MKDPTIEKVVVGEDCRLQKIELSRLTPCRGCGKEIGFIKTIRGKTIPVDPSSHKFLPDPEGENVYVTLEGTVEHGRELPILSNDPDLKYGFTSHFATCPEADRMRRRKR